MLHLWKHTPTYNFSDRITLKHSPFSCQCSSALGPGIPNSPGFCSLPGSVPQTSPQGLPDSAEGAKT